MVIHNESESSSSDQKLTNFNRVMPLKRTNIQLWIGSMIRVTSLVGIVLGFLGMMLVPIFATRVSSWMDKRMEWTTNETSRLADSIDQADIALGNGLRILEKAEETIRSLENSIEDSGALIDSSASLIGGTAPEIIADTHEALVTAEEGARAVDQVLRNLAKISFLTGVSYAPEKALDEAISDVADSLEPLPEALRQVGEELSQTHVDIDDVCAVLSDAADELEGFTAEFDGKNETLVTLADGLEDLAREIDAARSALRPVTLMSVLLIEILLIGHVMGQVAIYYVGREMAARIQNESVESIESLSDDTRRWSE